jgi:hypothetical protein
MGCDVKHDVVSDFLFRAPQRQSLLLVVQLMDLNVDSGFLVVMFSPVFQE